MGTKKSSVLLVDDRESYVNDLAVIFQLEGFQADAVTSVDAAVSLLSQNQYDLMVCDMFMPPGDLLDELSTQGGLRTGVFFCQYVKVHYPNMPTIILTARSVFEFDRDFLFGNSIKILNKGDLTQVDVVGFCKEFLSTGAEVRATDILEIKPGVFGVKIDVKKIFQYIKNREKK